MATPDAAEELLAAGSVTVQGAVKEFGLGRTRLYTWMEKGVLPYSQVGAKRLIPRVALRRLVAAGLIGVNNSEK